MDSSGKYIIAVQMLFSHGYSSPLFKKNDVDEHELKEIRLKPDQAIETIQIRMTSVGNKNWRQRLLTNDGQVFFEFHYFFPQETGNPDVPVHPNFEIDSAEILIFSKSFTVFFKVNEKFQKQPVQDFKLE